ncbi:MAG TPA: hypothetical protein EYQ32_13135 [Gammaproteobacteria bacterium]|nr:hypothetical protein [Gammaproteobacteria bacterium]
MLSIVSQLGPPTKKDTSLEKEFEQKEAQRFKAHPKSGIWKDITLQEHRSIDWIDGIHSGDKKIALL